jgi:hypothetical protein
MHREHWLKMLYLRSICTSSSRWQLQRCSIDCYCLTYATYPPKNVAAMAQKY